MFVLVIIELSTSKIDIIYDFEVSEMIYSVRQVPAVAITVFPDDYHWHHMFTLDLVSEKMGYSKLSISQALLSQSSRLHQII